MVKFMVNVRLMEKSVKSHVGRVMVEKVMIQYKTLGITWKMKVNTHPIHPAMVEGVGGGRGGGGRRVEVDAGTALRRAESRSEGDGGTLAEVAAVWLRDRDGARPLWLLAMMDTGLHSEWTKGAYQPNSKLSDQAKTSTIMFEPIGNVRGTVAGGWRKERSRTETCEWSGQPVVHEGWPTEAGGGRSWICRSLATR